MQIRCKLDAAITSKTVIFNNSETKRAKMTNEVSTTMFSGSRNTMKTLLK